MKTMIALAGIALAGLLATGANAADHRIEMLNKGALGTMVFEPGFVRVAPGDTVTFVVTDKTHNAETIPGLLPDGATPFKGKTNQEIQVQFDVPGAYAIKCLPHFAMGMVALVVVGEEAPDLTAIKAAKLPGKARERMDIYIAESEQ